MVSVFKTNVANNQESRLVINHLECMYPKINIEFDLEDVDNMLIIEGDNYKEDEIASLLFNLGFGCELLPF